MTHPALGGVHMNYVQSSVIWRDQLTSAHQTDLKNRNKVKLLFQNYDVVQNPTDVCINANKWKSCLSTERFNRMSCGSLMNKWTDEWRKWNRGVTSALWPHVVSPLWLFHFLFGLLTSCHDCWLHVHNYNELIWPDRHIGLSYVHR